MKYMLFKTLYQVYVQHRDDKFTTISLCLVQFSTQKYSSIPLDFKVQYLYLQLAAGNRVYL